MKFDYMVGAKLDGFDTMVSLTDAPVIVVEGDEYLASPIDRRPKFHLYHADIGVISGIAWDHINVFPVFDDYVKQFRIFADGLPADGTLIYCECDKEVVDVARHSVSKAAKSPYGVPSHRIENGVTILQTTLGDVPIKVFGTHNLMNMEAARLVCERLGISDDRFYPAIATFKGAARRLELLGSNTSVSVFKDFAHSPSKLKATTAAVRQQFPERKLIACMELHTFSSLNQQFLQEYHGSMEGADVAMVYYNPHTIAHKKLPPISIRQVEEAFGKSGLRVYTDSGKLRNDLLASEFKDAVVLLMSSGNFDGVSLEELSAEILQTSLAIE
jgi:UDP-N-acetylmuramate: L-alanyl-gamma-D-glutamyl-meso-diaminopimelate ligase